jgi:hypothetical protein
VVFFLQSHSLTYCTLNLQRKRENDIPHIQRMLKYLMSLVPEYDRHPIALLIFPEGTDLSDSNVHKSNAFAREKNLEERRFVLYPKSTGVCIHVCISILYMYVVCIGLHYTYHHYHTTASLRH